MLFESPILGNKGDLFIVQKQRDGAKGVPWGRPYFTGLWTNRTATLRPSQTFRGRPIPRSWSAAWFRTLANDRGIRRDTDGDGLTDLVEARLGTNPAKADTDGDGLSDAVDPALRVLTTDAEKIVAACVEARFFDFDWRTPASIRVENVRPFPLQGYPSTLLWQTPGQKRSLDRFYGGGVNFLSFHSPDAKRDQQQFIQYSQDHNTARTVLHRDGGVLNGEGLELTLKKIGTEWLVIDLKVKYVS